MNIGSEQASDAIIASGTRIIEELTINNVMLFAHDDNTKKLSILREKNFKDNNQESKTS